MANLKDLIVTGPARFLNKIYGDLEGNSSTTSALKNKIDIKIADPTGSNFGTIRSVDMNSHFNLPMPTTATGFTSITSTEFIGTVTKVNITDTNSPSGTIYRIPFTSGIGSQGLLANDGIGYFSREGTTSVTGIGELKLGNSKTSDTVGNKKGYIYMYGSSSGYTEIIPGNNTTNNVIVFLPSSDGTIALTTSNITGSSRKLSYSNQLTTDDLINNFNSANTFQVSTWNNTSSPGVINGIIINAGWTSDSYGAQIAIDDDPTYYIALRQKDTNGWKAWKRIPMGDGTGASGTWGISITGNAASASKLTVNAGDSNTPVYFEDGVPKAVTSINVKPDKAGLLDPGKKINGTLFTGAADITTANWGTSRNFTIGNSTKSVNGSAAITWTLSDIGAVSKAGDTMIGALNFKNNTWNNVGNDAAIGNSNQAGKFCVKGLNGATGIYFAPYSGSTAQTITIDGSGTMTITGTVSSTFKGSLNGNASSATKLQTSRNIFGRSFNGTADIAGKATVYGSYNSTVNSRYSTAALEIRENGLVGTGQTNIGYAPQIGFHWYGRAAGQLALGSDAKFRFIKEDGNTATLVATLEGYASSAGSSTSASFLSPDATFSYTRHSLQYFNTWSYAGAAVGVNDTPTSNWWHIIRHTYNHSDRYYTDVAIPFNENQIYYKRVMSGALQNGGWVMVYDTKSLIYSYSEPSSPKVGTIWLKPV